MIRKVWTTLFIATCLVWGGAAHAQVARSQFNGTVTDAAGGVLVGATIVATNVETNVESKSTTTDAGIYVLPYLPAGVYRVQVSAPGFRTAASDNVTLRAAQTLTLDFKLEVDAITETVNIEAPMIETSTAAVVSDTMRMKLSALTCAPTSSAIATRFAAAIPRYFAVSRTTENDTPSFWRAASNR